MSQTVRVGIIADYDPKNPGHDATDEALRHAARALATTVEIAWLTTPNLESGQAGLAHLDAFFAPSSPCTSMSGALNAIRFARERGKPFFGT